MPPAPRTSSSASTRSYRRTRGDVPATQTFITSNIAKPGASDTVHLYFRRPLQALFRLCWTPTTAVSNVALTGPAGTSETSTGYQDSYDIQRAPSTQLTCPPGAIRWQGDRKRRDTSAYSFRLLDLTDGRAGDDPRHRTAVNGTLDPRRLHQHLHFQPTPANSITFDVDSTTSGSSNGGCLGPTATHLPARGLSADSGGDLCPDSARTRCWSKGIPMPRRLTIHSTSNTAYIPPTPLLSTAPTLGTPYTSDIASQARADRCLQLYPRQPRHALFRMPSDPQYRPSDVPHRAHRDSPKRVHLSRFLRVRQLLHQPDFFAGRELFTEHHGPRELYRKLLIPALRPPTATAETIPPTGLVVSDTLNLAAATNAYSFTGAAGEQLYFNAQIHHGQFDWRLLDPYGNPVFQQGGFNDAEVTLPSTGTYTLLVEGYYYATGTQNFQFGIYSVVPTVTPISLEQPTTTTSPLRARSTPTPSPSPRRYDGRLRLDQRDPALSTRVADRPGRVGLQQPFHL